MANIRLSTQVIGGIAMTLSVASIAMSVEKYETPITLAAAPQTSWYMQLSLVRHQLPEDSITIGESLVFDTSKVFVDIAALTDTVAITYEKVLFDEITLEDDFSSLLATERLFANSLGLADVAVFGTGKGLFDQLSITDTTAFDVGTSYTDAVVIADELVSNVGKPFGDAVALTDVSYRNPNKGLFDSVSFTEEMLFVSGKGLQDIIAISELVQKGVTTPFADNISLQDLVGLTPQKITTDLISLEDSFSATLILNTPINAHMFNNRLLGV